MVFPRAKHPLSLIVCRQKRQNGATTRDCSSWNCYSRSLLRIDIVYFNFGLQYSAIEEIPYLTHVLAPCREHVNELKALDEGFALLRERCDFGVSRVQVNSDYSASESTA